MSYQQCTRFRTTLGLRSRISLERIKQSTSEKRRYQLRLFPRLMKAIWWTLVHWRKNDLDLWPWNKVRSVVKIHSPAKFHQAACSGWWVIVITEKKNSDEKIRSVATARTVIMTLLQVHGREQLRWNWTNRDELLWQLPNKRKITKTPKIL